MNSQKGELQTVLRDLEEDTKNLRKAKDIETKTKAMSEEFRGIA